MSLYERTGQCPICKTPHYDGDAYCDCLDPPEGGCPQCGSDDVVVSYRRVIGGNCRTLHCRNCRYED